jgi:hypothetical protein
MYRNFCDPRKPDIVDFRRAGMTSLRRIVVVGSILIALHPAQSQPSQSQPPADLENCLEASNPTVDFGTVAIGEKADAHLFIYNFCNHPVPLKYIYIKPPFALEAPGLPPIAQPLGFTALKIVFKPSIPSPGLAKVILVGDTYTRVVLTARLQGEVARPAEVSLQSQPDHGYGGSDSTAAEKKP